MLWALDTNIVVMSLRQNAPPSVIERFRQLEPSNIVVPEIVRAELLHGCLKSQQIKKNLSAVSRFLAPYQHLPFDAEAAEHYADIRNTLERQGLCIGPNDLLIAATARAAKATLVTNNLKEFQRIPKLKCEDWTQVEPLE
ncbi:MAG: type II toxin-antitoxin system VapC family toxin [Verrucomicrobiales bacterium]|nr:type II toxin-antitoxin system VapC family toxin [Verrucomicrobiales bacterium]